MIGGADLVDILNGLVDWASMLDAVGGIVGAKIKSFVSRGRWQLCGAKGPFQDLQNLRRFS